MLAHNNKKPTFNNNHTTSKYARTKGPPHAKIHVIATACACSGGVSTASLSLPLPWLREFSLYPRLECVNTAPVLVIGASDKRPASSTEQGHFIFLTKITKKGD